MAVVLVWGLSAAGGGSSSRLGGSPSSARHHSPSSGAGGHAGPDVTDRVLASTSYVSVGGGRRREIARTFDDGPGPYTPKVLATLRRMHAPATFFWIGRWVSQYRSVAAAGGPAGPPIGKPTRHHAPP